MSEATKEQLIDQVFDLSDGWMGRVWVDGIEVLMVTKVCPDGGWIERYVTREDGSLVVNKQCDAIEREVLTGEIGYIGVNQSSQATWSNHYENPSEAPETRANTTPQGEGASNR